MLLKTIIPLILIIAVLALVDIDIYRHPRKKPLIGNPDMADIHDKSLAWFKTNDNNKAILSVIVGDVDGTLEQMSFVLGSNQLLGNALMMMMDSSEDVAELICDVVDQFRERHPDNGDDNTNEQKHHTN